MRAVHRFVASRRPACPAGEERGVIASANENGAPADLLLEVALETEGGVALGQHLLIDRAVRLVAGVATLPERFVLEHIRPPLHGVTLEAGVVSAHDVRAAALHRGAFVWIVASGAAHLAFDDRMMVRQAKLRAHILMALETGLRVFLRIHDLPDIAAALHVQAARPMTRFAADLLLAIPGQARMCRGMEVARDRVVARFATFRSDECCSGDARRRHERARGATGNQN